MNTNNLIILQEPSIVVVYIVEQGTYKATLSTLPEIDLNCFDWLMDTQSQSDEYPVTLTLNTLDLRI